jgi:hypothetical protein
MKTITREDYMNNSKELHNDYYLQFATSGIRRFVDNNYSIETIKAAIADDEHLNSDLLNIKGFGAPATPGYNGSHWMSIFDHISNIYKEELANVNFKINGSRSWSISIGTCAIKSYMRHLITLNNQ